MSALSAIQLGEVPAYEVTRLRASTSRLAVCVFVLNEGERILTQLRRMQESAHGLDVVLADGGSQDGSTESAQLHGLGVTALLVKTGPGKLSAQMRMALAWCMQQGYEGVVVMDGNNKDHPAGISRIAQALEEGYDHVQGSRFIPGGEAVNTPPFRLWGIKLLHAPLISLAARFRYTDTTNGSRGYSRRLLLDPRVAPFREVFARYELHYYLAIRAARLGFRVKEVPVSRVYPRGAIPTKIHGLRGNLSILKTVFSACLGAYNVADEGRP